MHFQPDLDFGHEIIIPPFAPKVKKCANKKAAQTTAFLRELKYTPLTNINQKRTLLSEDGLGSLSEGAVSCKLTEGVAISEGIVGCKPPLGSCRKRIDSTRP